MAKFYGVIGYVETKESTPGVWSEVITERLYYGDVIQFFRKWDVDSKVNDNVNINNKISIVADPFAYENFQYMRYVEWMGVKWKITNIEVQYPRLNLTIGGVYNEQTT